MHWMPRKFWTALCLPLPLSFLFYLVPFYFLVFSMNLWLLRHDVNDVCNSCFILLSICHANTYTSYRYAQFSVLGDGWLSFYVFQYAIAPTDIGILHVVHSRLSHCISMSMSISTQTSHCNKGTFLWSNSAISPKIRKFVFSPFGQLI